MAVLVMVLLPNAGNLSDTLWVALTLGAIILMFLDTSLNMAMQPFKMMVGDMVNEKQKDWPTPCRVFCATWARWWALRYPS